MAAATDISTRATTRSASRSTEWDTFSGQMLVVAGVLDVSYGLAGIVNEQSVSIGGGGGTVVDLAVWGWVPLLIGVAILLVAWGPLTGRSRSPRFAIGLLIASAMVQLTFVHAYPLWAMLMIVLDLAILDQLTTRWGDS